MTLDEAKKVALICCQADGGCSVCVSAHVENLNAMFPEFKWAYDPDGERTLKIPHTPGEEPDEEEYNYSSFVPIEVHLGMPSEPGP